MDKDTFITLKKLIPKSTNPTVILDKIDINLHFYKDFEENTRFVAEDVADFIKNNGKYITSMSKYNNITITAFHFDTETAEQNSVERHRKIHQIIGFITNLSQKMGLPKNYNHLLDKMNIRLYLVDKKKQINKNTVFTPNNTNSGFTNHEDIVIYRTEELYKVLIHELLHNVPLAPKELDADSSLIEKYLPCHQYIKYESAPLNLYEREQIYVREAYVETITSYLLCVLKSSDYEEFCSKLSSLTSYFKHMSLYLLQLRKCQSINKDCEWKETTNTFGYFIIKDEIFRNFKFNINKLSLSWKEMFQLCDLVCKEKKEPYDSTVIDKNSLRMTNLST